MIATLKVNLRIFRSWFC